MKYKNTAIIRQTFLDFFKGKGHKVVSSSSLIPNNDTSLLFTNAGMNQFKNVFLGKEKFFFSNITTCQRCVRAGGKHNDLENVGYTPSHHTFFEMLGNFSFGDYFKKKAINLAWELLTSSYWFNIPKEKLWITVHNTDHESYDIWANEIGIPRKHLISMGDKKALKGINRKLSESEHNFWKMADTGPCGPSTEIFYDRGNNFAGDPPGSIEAFSNSNNRYIEIWNIVFMEYNRQADGSMIPLTSPSIDTGMGLERIAAVLQKVETNYDIDIFRKLIKHVALITSISRLEKNHLHSLRVIADHIRSCAFLLADGLLPSNEGRGYVLRHLIRRAVRHGYILGTKETFFYKLVTPLIQTMETVADSIKCQQSLIENILKIEEEKFAQTLERGDLLLKEALSKLQGDTLDGDTAFLLYDTYGFPLELTTEICNEYQVKVDNDGFKLAMELQRQRSRKSNNFINHSKMINLNNVSTKFQGPDCNKLQATIIAIIVSHELQEVISDQQDGGSGIIILDRTPFYSESCGQVGDTGNIYNKNAEFIVTDTQRIGQAVYHIGKIIHGCFRRGDEVIACIDSNRRHKICRNHSATHLLHAALRKVLGTHVIQKGSLINEKYLRFDFFHFAKIKPEEIRAIECMVNTEIIHNLPVTSNIMEYEIAKEKGAIALFDNKYGKYVRVLKIGNFSTELCDGTHVQHTGQIGLFRINAESNIAAGIRRIEASTAEMALEKIQKQKEVLQNISFLLKSPEDKIIEKIHSLKQEISIMKNNLAQLTTEKIVRDCIFLLKEAILINQTNIIINHLNNTEVKTLKSIVTNLKKEIKSGLIILGTVTNKNQVLLIAAVTPDLTNKFTANDLIKRIIPKINGKGGGCQQIAQAYGTSITVLPTVLSEMKNFIINKLSVI
ncbi:MAG: alanine--tRNA ligase [Candidatus Dasytiphilus stammeri]